MTLTLEIDADTAAALAAEAARRRAPMETVVADALRVYQSAPQPNKQREAILARIQSGYYASRLTPSEIFSARKVEESALEERRWWS